jgi:CRISPR type III-B/RAMP module-associated protein Cmr3
MNHDVKHEYIYGFVVDIILTPPSPDDAPLSDTQVQQELHLPDTGWMTLGGEQRAAHFRVLSTPQTPARPLSREHALLYLATPATFDTGWKPSSKFAPLDAPLTAAITRYESIGGWKLNPGDAKGENKAMHRCVPAGSVYFYDKRVTPPQAMTDYGMEIGYGITVEGEW